MDNTEEIEVMTYDEAYYLDVESTKESNATADIQLMNVGVTKFEESSNPTEKSTQYIGDKSKTNKVTDKEGHTIDLPAKLFGEIAEKYAGRQGGYTRIYKMGPRRGDSAEVVIIELV